MLIYLFCTELGMKMDQKQLYAPEMEQRKRSSKHNFEWNWAVLVCVCVREHIHTEYWQADTLAVHLHKSH